MLQHPCDQSAHTVVWYNQRIKEKDITMETKRNWFTIAEDGTVNIPADLLSRYGKYTTL